MNNPNDYLKELQNFDAEQGKAKLRTLALEFHSTLARLPKLKQEIEMMLQQDAGINYDELVVRLESPLEKATALLLEFDMLPSELRNAREIQDFSQAMAATLTVRTVDGVVLKFREVCNQVRSDIKRQADKQADEKRRGFQLRQRKIEEQEAQRAADEKQRQEAEEAQLYQREKEELASGLPKSTFIINFHEGTFSMRLDGLNPSKLYTLYILHNDRHLNGSSSIINGGWAITNSELKLHFFLVGVLILLFVAEKISL